MGVFLNRANNYIINGDMDICQRLGTGNSKIQATMTGTASSPQYQFVNDRFRVTCGISGLGNITAGHASIVTDRPNSADRFNSALEIKEVGNSTGITNTSLLNISQTVEESVARRLYNKHITLSFWVYAGNPGVYSVSFKDGSSFSPKSYVTTFSVTTGLTWEKKIITIFLGTPEGNAGGLSINWCFSKGSDITNVHQSTSILDTWISGQYNCASNNTSVFQGQSNYSGVAVRLTGVQLEEGRSSSNFQLATEHSGSELLLCQRYYENSSPHGYPENRISEAGALSKAESSTGLIHVKYKVRKRTTFPSYKYWSAATGTQYYIGHFLGSSITDKSYATVTFDNRIGMYSSQGFVIGVAGCTVGALIGINWAVDADI